MAHVPPSPSPRHRPVVGAVPVIQRSPQQIAEYAFLARVVPEPELANVAEYISETLAIPVAAAYQRFRQSPPDAQLWNLLDHPDRNFNMMERLRASVQPGPQAQVPQHQFVQPDPQEQVQYPSRPSLPSTLRERLGPSVSILEEALVRAFPPGLNKERRVPVATAPATREHKLSMAPWAQVVQSLPQDDEQAWFEQYVPYAYNDFVDWVAEAFGQFIAMNRVMARVASWRERPHVMALLIGLMAEFLQKSYVTVLNHWLATNRYPEREPKEFALDLRRSLASRMKTAKTKVESEYLFRIHGSNLPHGVRYFVRQWYQWQEDHTEGSTPTPTELARWAEEASQHVRLRSEGKRRLASSSPEAIKEQALSYLQFIVTPESDMPEAGPRQESPLERAAIVQPVEEPPDLQVGATTIPREAVNDLLDYLGQREIHYFHNKGKANDRLFTLWFFHCIVNGMDPGDFARAFPDLNLITYDKGVPRLYSHKVRRTVAPLLTEWVSDWVSWFTDGEWALSDRQKQCVEFLMRSGSLDEMPPQLAHCTRPATGEGTLLPGPQAQQ